MGKKNKKNIGKNDKDKSLPLKDPVKTGQKRRSTSGDVADEPSKKRVKPTEQDKRSTDRTNPKKTVSKAAAGDVGGTDDDGPGTSTGGVTPFGAALRQQGKPSKIRKEVVNNVSTRTVTKFLRLGGAGFSVNLVAMEQFIAEEREKKAKLSQKKGGQARTNVGAQDLASERGGLVVEDIVGRMDALFARRMDALTTGISEALVRGLRQALPPETVKEKVPSPAKDKEPDSDQE